MERSTESAEQWLYDENSPYIQIAIQFHQSSNHIIEKIKEIIRKIFIEKMQNDHQMGAKSKIEVDHPQSMGLSWYNLRIVMK